VNPVHQCSSPLRVARCAAPRQVTKPLQVRGLSPIQIFEGYAALATVVVAAIIPPAIIDDPDDDAVLACAVAAKADFVVSATHIC
jgi:hypothetical protein